MIEAEFEFPYLAHAAMEPLDAVARMQDGALEIWAGHQMPDLYRQVGAEIMGIAPDKVKLHVMTPGGCFGRRAVPDADVIVEAVSVPRRLGGRAPVKVQWTREDDMTGRALPPDVLSPDCRRGSTPTAGSAGWHHRIVGQSIMAGTPFEQMMVKNSVDPTSVEGAVELCPMPSPTCWSTWSTTDVSVPVLWWRSVGSTHTAYSTEVLIDELAEAAGPGPGRLPPRGSCATIRAISACSKLVADKAGWGTPLPGGRARGIAVHESFDSYVAQVAEVSVRAGRRHRGRARGLRGRLRHRRQPGHDPGADGGRHRLRPRRDPQERDHLRQAGSYRTTSTATRC